MRSTFECWIWWFFFCHCGKLGVIKRCETWTKPCSTDYLITYTCNTPLQFHPPTFALIILQFDPTQENSISLNPKNYWYRYLRLYMMKWRYSICKSRFHFTYVFYAFLLQLNSNWHYTLIIPPSKSNIKQTAILWANQFFPYHIYHCLFFASLYFTKQRTLIELK